MARVIKPREPHHTFTVLADQKGHNCTLVGSGRRSYLWIGLETGGGVTTISGQQTLRALARAILREIPAKRRAPSGGGGR